MVVVQEAGVEEGRSRVAMAPSTEASNLSGAYLAVAAQEAGGEEERSRAWVAPGA